MRFRATRIQHAKTGSDIGGYQARVGCASRDRIQVRLTEYIRHSTLDGFARAGRAGVGVVKDDPPKSYCSGVAPGVGHRVIREAESQNAHISASWVVVFMMIFLSCLNAALQR